MQGFDVDSLKTIEAFASLRHPHRVWRVLERYFGNTPGVAGLITCLAAGVTATAELAEILDVSVETIEVRKAQLHRAVRSLEKDIEMHTGAKEGLSNPRNAEFLDNLLMASSVEPEATSERSLADGRNARG